MLLFQPAAAGARRANAISLWRAALYVAACVGLAPVAHAQFFALARSGYPLEFYDIDFGYLAGPARRIGPFDALHYIPLGGDAYLSLGGELREQAWAQNNESHRLKAPFANTYDLQRLLGDAYLHFDRHFALFMQIGRFDAIDKLAPLNAADKSEGRVQQGFLELKEELGPTQMTTRLGRQEITLGSARFVWVNDSSNIRTTQDGARVHFDYPSFGTLDLMYTRPTNPVIPAFDDWDSHAGTFGAVYASQSLLPNKAFNFDEYYFFRHNIGAQYAGLTGNEDRDTVGGRLWGTFGSLKYDSDFAYQFGTYAGKDISAFGTSTRALYTLESVVWQPGLQFQTSYFSGSGPPGSNTIGTFAAPFPRATSLNYAGLETLENLVEAYPALVVNPAPNLAFRFGPEVLWRASVFDAVYISRATPLPATMSAKDRASYIGTNLIATASWNVTANINVFAEYLHELAGPAITLAGGRGADVGVLQVDFNF
jgi:Alginate export